MPAPPLQRAAGAHDRTLRRLAALAAAALALLALGWWGGRRSAPPLLMATAPGEQPGELARQLERLMAGAQRRVWCALYVVRPDGDGPVQGLLEALAAAAARGIDVRIALDAGPDPVTKVDDGRNQAAAQWLSAHGVRVVWDEPRTTTHLKVVVVDGRWVVAGSHNWTRAALTANRELSLLVDDQAAAAAAEAVLRGIPGW